ncbi:MAG: MATE family efflux transporter, partial [Betaproteobacteria bacterium]|nr:MATE family efflux transporter [Betaproteobacteria bacterium]
MNPDGPLAPQRTRLKQLLRLAGPVLVSQLAVMANGVIDTVMAGHLSPTELASLGLGT